MREIKFRAWDKEEKRMLPEVLAFGGKQDNNLYMCSVLNDITDYSIGKFELMQFTGLKDKNGVEIYEGDVVRYEYITRCDETEKETDTVKCDEWHCGFTPFSYQKDVDDCWYNYIIKEETLEVIGNIYENPELLDTNK